MDFAGNSYFTDILMCRFIPATIMIPIVGYPSWLFWLRLLASLSLTMEARTYRHNAIKGKFFPCGYAARVCTYYL